MEENKNENLEEQKDNKAVESNSSDDSIIEQNTEHNIEEESKESASKENVQEQKDIKFKKVEGNSNKKTEKKKTHKVLKIFLVLILILIIIYIIFVTRNYFILKDIVEKSNNYNNITNFSYEATSVTGGDEINIKYYKKDNTDRTELEGVSDQNKSIIIWRNFDTNEGIISFPKNEVAYRTEADKTISLNPNIFEFSDMLDTENIAYYIGLLSLIYTEEYNGKDCYIIQINNDYKYWIDKETGFTLKRVNGSIENNCISYETNNIDEIYKPDLTGYEVKDYIDEVYETDLTGTIDQ